MTKKERSQFRRGVRQGSANDYGAKESCRKRGSGSASYHTVVPASHTKPFKCVFRQGEAILKSKEYSTKLRDRKMAGETEHV